MTYYIKGGSRYNAANPKVWVGLFLGGFPDADYLLTDWINLDDKGHETAQDPFYRLGGASGGAKEFELGLWNDFRIKFETTGITYWDGDSWNDLLTGGGGKDNLYELDDVVIDGTPADNELLAWDNGSSKWINQTPGEAGLATAGHGHGQLHDESHSLSSHSSEAHNELTGYNDETDVKHLTDAQVTALHAAAHTHNGDTLQLDGINSDGGVFSFTTTGAVTFNQDITIGTNKWASAGNGSYFRYNSTSTAHLSISMDSHASIDGIIVRQNVAPLASTFKIITSGGANIFEVDVNNDVNINGDIVLDSGKVITSADEDLTFTFGRGGIFSPSSDQFGIGHRDNLTTGSCALRQTNDGITILNAKLGKYIGFHINGVNRFYVDVNALYMNVPIAMGANAITSNDADTTFIFGRGAIGSPAADIMYLAHRDNLTTSNYALWQLNTGATSLNAKAGQSLYLRINNAELMVLDVTNLTMSVPIAMGANNITGLANGAGAQDAMAFGQKYTNSEVDTRIGLANHDVLQNPNGNAEEQHLTSAQQGALHAILTNLNQLATREHNDLQLKNAHADYKHITTPQLIALHTIYQDAAAVQAVEDAGLVLSATKTITTANEATTHTFGRQQLGKGGDEAGYATFGFRGMALNEYTIRANSAFTETRINVGQGAGSKIRMGVNESNTLNIGVNGVTFGIGDEVNQFDNGDVGNNSAIRVPTQQAVKTYHDANKTVAGDLNLNDLAEKSHDNLADVSINDHHAEVHAMSVHSNEGNHVTHNYGSGASTVCQGNDGRLTNNRTPTQHALDSATYHTINANTTFNATTSKHGFLKLLDNDATKFMNGQGNWAIPAGEGGGSLKGQLQGHIVPLVGCVWGSSGINMYDANDSAICTFDLTANIDAGEDIVLGFVYSNTWDSQSTMKLYVGIQKTNGTEALTWNYINGSNYVLSTSATDFSFKVRTWTIPNAVFDTNDTITVYFLNQSGVNFRAHSMYLRYTEAV